MLNDYSVQLYQENGDAGGGGGSPATSADPPQKLDPSSFAQDKLNEGSARTFKTIKDGLGLGSNSDIKDPDSLVAFIVNQQKNARSQTEDTQKVKDDYAKTIAEKDAAYNELKTENTALKLDNEITGALAEHKLAPKDLEYLKFKIRKDYSFENNQIAEKATGKPLINATTGQYSSVSDLIKDLSANEKIAEKLFDAAATVTGSGNTSQELTDEAIKAKLSDPEFLAKVAKQGLMQELQTAIDMPQTKAVIAKVKE